MNKKRLLIGLIIIAISISFVWLVGCSGSPEPQLAIETVEVEAPMEEAAVEEPAVM